MQHRRLSRLSPTCALALTLLAASALAQGAPEPLAPFEQARAEYEIGHYPQAYARFAQLADGGHAEAARIALQMRRHGRTLYGSEFTAVPSQIERWARLLACGTDDPCRLAGPAS